MNDCATKIKSSSVWKGWKKMHTIYEIWIQKIEIFMTNFDEKWCILFCLENGLLFNFMNFSDFWSDEKHLSEIENLPATALKKKKNQGNSWIEDWKRL